MSQIPLGLKKAATLCVLRHQNQLLLLKRWKEPNKDLFTPVGGKLDPFEGPPSGCHPGNSGRNRDCPKAY